MIIEINEEERKLLIKYLKDGLIYSRESYRPQCQQLLEKFAQEDDYIEKFIEALIKENEEGGIRFN